jgi:hypothetical protein
MRPYEKAALEATPRIGGGVFTYGNLMGESARASGPYLFHMKRNTNLCIPEVAMNSASEKVARKRPATESSSSSSASDAIFQFCARRKRGCHHLPGRPKAHPAAGRAACSQGVPVSVPTRFAILKNGREKSDRFPKIRPQFQKSDQNGSTTAHFASIHSPITPHASAACRRHVDLQVLPRQDTHQVVQRQVHVAANPGCCAPPL